MSNRSGWGQRAGSRLAALVGVVEAEDLGDSAAQQRRLCAQQRHLFGMLQQQQQATGNHALGGGATGRVQREERRQDLLVGELLAVLLREHEGGDEVISWLGAALFDDVGDELQLPHECVAACLTFVRQRSRVTQSLGALERRPELAAGIGRYAQHLRGDGDGEREGQLGHQVEMARGQARVDELVDELGDATALLVDGCASERLLHQLPHARVGRRVLHVERVQHHLLGA